MISKINQPYSSKVDLFTKLIEHDRRLQENVEPRMLKALEHIVLKSHGLACSSRLMINAQLTIEFELSPSRPNINVN